VGIKVETISGSEKEKDNSIHSSKDDI